jgi:inosine-uridine nucleoside N-ribohydrolase
LDVDGALKKYTQEIMQRIWIDTDIAMGMSPRAPSRDVDDGWAVASLLRAATIGKVEIAGISVCDGNTDAASAFCCLQSLLRVMGIDSIPIVASDAAAKSIAALQEDGVLLALGPLTNIANALAMDPALAQRTSLITVGGVLNGWNFRRRLSDLNIRRDPRAAAMAYSTFADCRRMPLDVIDRLTIDTARIDRIGTSGAVGGYLANHSQRWLKGATWRHGRAAFPVWDLVAALAAMDALPGARYDVQNRLTTFDVSEAWRVIESLLAG